MKSETIEHAKLMLVKLLEEGASYAQAGEPFGLGRSTVERNVKALLRELVSNGAIAGLDEDGMTSFALVRRASREVLAALDGHEPGLPHRFPAMLTEVDLEQASLRLRRRSQHARRDSALIALLYQTGAKPVELARLEVRDVLTPGGSVRVKWHMREDVAINGLRRPLPLSSATVRSVLDLYLDERVRRFGRTSAEDLYRGLDPRGALFLTSHGDGFEIRPRSARDSRQTCPLMTATLRLAFRRAGWPGLTAQAVRRMVACRLREEGALPEQIARLLGLRSERAARLLIGLEKIELSAAESAPGLLRPPPIERVTSTGLPVLAGAAPRQPQAA